MKLRTSELTERALEWAVAAAGFVPGTARALIAPEVHALTWALGGPIIEREGIELVPRPDHQVEGWSARAWANNAGMVRNAAQRFKHNIQAEGPTLLIAAMRGYVASKLGDEVDVPEEFLQQSSMEGRAAWLETLESYEVQEGGEQ